MKNQTVLNKLSFFFPHKWEVSTAVRNLAWYSLGISAGFYLCHILRLDLILPLFLLLIVIYLKVLYRDINQAPYKFINLAFVMRWRLNGYYI